jgi:hypothetical protein
MREHRRESFRKVSTCENFRKFSITTIIATAFCDLSRPNRPNTVRMIENQVKI